MVGVRDAPCLTPSLRGALPALAATLGPTLVLLSWLVGRQVWSSDTSLASNSVGLWHK